MSERNAASAPNPTPARAFWLTIAAPGLGHLLAGSGRRARHVALIPPAVMAAAVFAAMLPPVSLPMLLLMAAPFVALPVFVLAAAVDAAREAQRGGAPPPITLSSPLLATLGIAVWVVELAIFAGLVLSVSSVGFFRVTDDRMAPTLLDGDRVVVWRSYYRDHLPERGDLAVVVTPGAEDRPRIMRILGLPGDSVLGVLGTLTINGEAIERTRAGDFAWRDEAGLHRTAPRHRETLPGGRAYEILQSAEGMFRGTLLGASLKIPDGDYFVIGDNRDETGSSWDFGFLPGLVLGDRPTVVVGSDDRSRIGRAVQP